TRVRRITRNTIALSSQSCGRPSPPRRQRRDIEVISGRRVFSARGHVRVWPVAHEGSVSRLPDVEGIPLLVGGYSRRRDRPNPAHSPVPGANGLRIVYRNLPVLIENGPTPLGNLPFQSVAGQSLRRRPLPHITPKIFIPLGALTGLNPLRHLLKLFPRFRRRSVAVLLQNVD